MVNRLGLSHATKTVMLARSSLRREVARGRRPSVLGRHQIGAAFGGAAVMVGCCTRPDTCVTVGGGIRCAGSNSYISSHSHFHPTKEPVRLFSIHVANCASTRARVPAMRIVRRGSVRCKPKSRDRYEPYRGYQPILPICPLKSNVLLRLRLSEEKLEVASEDTQSGTLEGESYVSYSGGGKAAGWTHSRQRLWAPVAAI